MTKPVVVPAETRVLTREMFCFHLGAFMSQAACQERQKRAAELIHNPHFRKCRECGGLNINEGIKNMGKRMTCGWCERQDMSMSKKFEGVFACGFCTKNLEEGSKNHGLRGEQMKPILMDSVKRTDNGGRAVPIYWPDLIKTRGLKTDQVQSEPEAASKREEEPSKVGEVLPCINMECMDWARRFPGNCGKGEDPEIRETCGYYHGEAPRAAKPPVEEVVAAVNQYHPELAGTTFEEAISSDQDKPLPWPWPDSPLPEESKAPATEYKPRQITFILEERDADLLAWLQEKATEDRRSIDQEILALLDYMRGRFASFVRTTVNGLSDLDAYKEAEKEQRRVNDNWLKV